MKENKAQKEILIDLITKSMDKSLKPSEQTQVKKQIEILLADEPGAVVPKAKETPKPPPVGNRKLRITAVKLQPKATATGQPQPTENAGKPVSVMERLSTEQQAKDMGKQEIAKPV